MTPLSPVAVPAAAYSNFQEREAAQRSKLAEIEQERQQCHGQVEAAARQRERPVHAAKGEHPVYDPQATIAQYKICVEQARAVLQAETQNHDIDAPYHWATNGAICKARMDNALHEGFRYQIMHQSSEASAAQTRLRAANNNEVSNVPNVGRVSTPNAPPDAPAAHAEDPRCNAPPYGGTVAGYKAFVETFGHLAVPTTMLPAVCNAKYGGADRTGLYNLGFTDQEIDSKDTEDLAVDMITALKKLVDKLPAETFGR